jgi:hypothetical protein
MEDEAESNPQPLIANDLQLGPIHFQECKINPFFQFIQKILDKRE